MGGARIASGPRLDNKTATMSLSSKIGWAMIVGLGAGLFFGELMAPLEIVADAFIKLLQMTVLPYVIVSLIAGLGGQSIAQARTIARNVGGLLLVLWTIVLALVVVAPLAFPDWQTASFFSTSLVHQPQSFDFVDLYIPANPFRSLSDNIVPAVVLFSVVVGVALIGIERKAALIDTLEVLGDALARVTHFVVALTPIGIFAIAASAAGTMTIVEFERLQVFFVTYIGLALLLVAWILPGLVATVTPFSYREVFGLTRDALITAFMTGNFFIVLPILTETSKELFRRHDLGGDAARSAVDVIVPASFNFPNTGKLLSILFVLFAAWFSDVDVAITEYPAFLATAVVSLFGNVNVAIPFLLDTLRVPADMFQLFIVSGVINARFGALLAAVHTVVLALVGTCAIVGALRLDPARIGRFAVITVLLTVAVIGGSRLFLATMVDSTYTKAEIVRGMQLLRAPTPATVHREAQPPLPAAARTARLASIEKRGALRVGYIKDNLPFAFFNGSDELVGFDVEMAHQLARELEVTLELVPVGRWQVEEALAGGCCDLVMAGYNMTTERARAVRFSRPYLDQRLAFLVKDHDRSEFLSLAQLAAREELHIGVPRVPYYVEKLRQALPQATLEPIEDFGRMLDDWPDQRDAVLFTAESGAAYTLLHPSFSVVIPHPLDLRAPLAYPMPHDDPQFAAFIDSWIELKKRDGTIDRLYDYWILGNDARPARPRWSVVRDVLGWTD